jgi:glutamate-1-semialdehyde 2,1-aminomutase
MGHVHPAITEAVVEQAQKGTHYGASHRLELDWGHLVQRVVPSAQEIRFTSSGTEATLMAIRLARAYTGRDRLLKFDHHFHGWHDAVVGARHSELAVAGFAGIPEATLANTVSVPQNDLAEVRRELADGTVAAVILEPTGASWGTLPLREGFLAELRQLTLKHNTVLIFDEVVTGFRVAPGGAQERYGVTPDLTTLAKILAGGLPGGAVAGKVDILSMLEFRSDPAWNAERRVAHPGTFNANPLSAAAGVAMLSMVATGEHHRHSDRLNARLVSELNAVLDRAHVAGTAYGLASYFHIVLGRETPRPVGGIEWPWRDGDLPPRTPGGLVVTLKQAMLNNGVDLMGGSGGFVSGVHSDQDIDRTVLAFESSVRAMKAEGLV